MPKKVISPDDKLRAFAMYVLACQQYTEVRKLERGIAKIVGTSSSGDYNDFISDSIYSSNDPSGSSAEFDEALKISGVVVQRRAKKSR